MAVQVIADGADVILAVYVTPRAGRSEVVGERDGALWVRLAAPPVEGAANRALVDLLAQRLGVPRNAVSLVAGVAGRRKRGRIIGLSPEVVASRLGVMTKR
ncbi:MAG: DUF167 domain-containing protein [Chloroflexota bacterium]